MDATLPFDELFASARTRAWHLEMRDGYMRSSPAFQAWQQGHDLGLRPEVQAWHQLVGEAVARGVQVRRARIVSEPVTDYIRWEHSVTASSNVAAGEQVRWLPRRTASDLAVPANDFWLFDDVVLFNHFTGDGEPASGADEIRDDPAVVKLCAQSFEAVWERAIPHEQYQPS